MTTPRFFTEEHKILTALFEEGLEELHLRKPGYDVVYTERLLALIPQQYRQRIVIHDFFYLKKEYGLRGIHLSARSPQVPEDYRGRVSLSASTLAEAKALSKKVNYCLWGPMPSPDDCMAVQGFNEAKKLGYMSNKIFAAGNVTLSTIPLARRIGFGGVVVRDDVWNKFDIHTANDYNALIEHFKQLKKAVY